MRRDERVNADHYGNIKNVRCGIGRDQRASSARLISNNIYNPISHLAYDVSFCTCFTARPAVCHVTRAPSQFAIGKRHSSLQPFRCTPIPYICRFPTNMLANLQNLVSVALIDQSTVSALTLHDVEHWLLWAMISRTCKDGNHHGKTCFIFPSPSLVLNICKAQKK